MEQNSLKRCEYHLRKEFHEKSHSCLFQTLRLFIKKIKKNFVILKNLKKKLQAVVWYRLLFWVGCGFCEIAQYKHITLKFCK